VLKHVWVCPPYFIVYISSVTLKPIDQSEENFTNTEIILSIASCALLCGQYWVYLGVKTCEVFLCFLAIIFLGSIVWSSLVHSLCFRHFVLPPVCDNDRRKIKLKFIFLLVRFELPCLAVTISTRMKNRDLHLNTKTCDTSFSYFKKFAIVGSQLSTLPYVICGALVNYKNYI